MKFLCIVPIFNEESKLKNLLSNIIQSKNLLKDVDFLLVNNGSTDGSEKLIKESNLDYINFDKNNGVGFALINGLKIAIKNQYKYLIHLAGNGKMNPLQISDFKKKLVYENYQFVSGSRFINKIDHETNPLSRIILIKILSMFISLIYKRKITDATCGFRAFETKLFEDDINFFDKNDFYTYKYEYYSIGKILLNKNIKFTEIPVSMNYSKKNYSKIRPILDWIPIIKGWIEARINEKKIQ